MKYKNPNSINKTKNGEYETYTDEKNGKQKGKTKRRILKFALFCIILLATIIGGLGFGFLVGIMDATDGVSVQDLELSKLTTFFYDKDGNELSSVHDSENRVVVRYSEISPNIINAVISIEDERFLEHKGVDIRRTASAVVNYILKFGKDSGYGGSTITQQLVKNVTGDNDTAVTRKVREWVRAIQLEKQMSKEQIIEAYLNTIYFGSGAHGVEVASQTYFSKSAKDLSIAQAAFIGGIIQVPEYYTPYKGEENKKAGLERQQVVLNKMHQLGKITDAEYDTAKKEELVFKKGEVASGTTQSYFIDAVIEDVIKTIQEQKNLTRQEALKQIYGNGYKIYTTLDQNVQQIINEAYKDSDLFPVSTKYNEQVQSSMVIMDYKTGNVSGLIGGVGDKKESLSLNRATQTKRQPGSTMKPIAVYGPAIEKGTLAGAGSVIDDIPYTSGSWSPQNWYGKYYGYVTLREALNKSMNLPAVRTMQATGVDYCIDFVKSLGITSVGDNDKNLASALGGLNEGVSVMEMTSAYGVYANGGIYVKPRLFTKIVDKNGNEVVSNETSYKSVIKDTTAGMMTNLLNSVVTQGIGGRAKIPNMAVAGKTGTTNDSKDLWFVGYTPYYVAGLWYGYDQPKTLTTTSLHVVAWQKVMAKVHEKLEKVTSFTMPKGLSTVEVCKDSGMIPTDACRRDPRGNRVISEIFVTANIPTQSCSVHKEARICTETGKLATEFCPSTELKSFITREPASTSATDDQDFLLPKETCTVHTKAQVVTQPANNNAPVLMGITDVSTIIGKVFDPLNGISVSDKDESIAASKIKITGTVDTTKLGEYTLTYSITDSTGLVGTATRKVTVIPDPANP